MQPFTPETKKSAYYSQVTFCLDNLREQLLRLLCGFDVKNIFNYTDCERGMLDCNVTKNNTKGICTTWHFNKSFYQIISSESYSAFSIGLIVPRHFLKYPEKEISVIINDKTSVAFTKGRNYTLCPNLIIICSHQKLLHIAKKNLLDQIAHTKQI